MNSAKFGNAEIDHLGYAIAEADFRRKKSKLRRFTFEFFWTLGEVAIQLAAFAGGIYLLIVLGGLIAGQMNAEMYRL